MSSFDLRRAQVRFNMKQEAVRNLESQLSRMMAVVQQVPSGVSDEVIEDQRSQLTLARGELALAKIDLEEAESKCSGSSGS